MQELIKYIAQALVEYPEDVEVSETKGERSLIVELRVAKTDKGRIIGKQGHTAMAMRTVLNAASRKIKKNAILEIIE